jgi:anti-anti-sigma factor
VPWDAEEASLLADPLSYAHLAVDLSVRDGTAILTLLGELDLATRDVLAMHLAQAMSAGPERLVVDVSGLAVMDCGGARIIIDTGHALPDGRRPVLRSPTRLVRRLLKAAGLEANFDVEA